MKTKFTLLFLVGVIISSCDLQEQPYGFYSEDNFYQTAEDIKTALYYAYDGLSYLEYHRMIFYTGLLPTELTSLSPHESDDIRVLDDWEVESFSDNQLLTNYFKYSYIAINRTNSIIEKVPSLDFEDPSLKDKYLGEAYFLRAYNYFNLARNFGRVPIHTSLVNTLNETRTPIAENLNEIYDLILSDCDQAIELLDIDPKVGRVDQVAAQSLAAKVYLTIASSKEHGVPLYIDMPQDVEEMYDKAAEYAREVVQNQSAYGFDDDLLSIYDVDNPQGPEHIFLLSMHRTGSDEGDYSKVSKLFIPYIGGSTIYLNNHDGTYTQSHDGWGVIQTNTEFYNSFQDTDKRKMILMVDSVYNENGELVARYPGPDITYPFTRKYVDPHFIFDQTSTRPYLIRFSDIALVLAEAVGPTDEGYSLINYIRQRAGLENFPPGLSTEEFREAILQERSWELAFEGKRLFDLRRYNIVTDIVPEAAGLSAEDVAFYPIPQQEIDLNQDL